MGLLEDMTRRGRKFDIIDITLAQGPSMFSGLRNKFGFFYIAIDLSS